MPVCKLCGNPQPKMPRAHIVPDFLFAVTYDELNRNWTIRMGSDGDLHISKVPFQKRSPGRDVDTELTCFKCEERISHWEGYASKLIEGGINTHPRQRKLTDHSRRINLNYFNFSSVDYTKLRLFLLSMLWRASASAIPLCQNVSMGNQHESVIRDFLLNDVPGSENEYACVISFLVDGHYQGLSEFIDLDSIKIGSHNCVEIIAGGFDFIYFISNHKLPEFVRRLAVTANGELGVPLRRTADLPLVKRAVNSMKRQQGAFMVEHRRK